MALTFVEALPIATGLLVSCKECQQTVLPQTFVPETIWLQCAPQAAGHQSCRQQHAGYSWREKPSPLQAGHCGPVRECNCQKATELLIVR